MLTAVMQQPSRTATQSGIFARPVFQHNLVNIGAPTPKLEMVINPCNISNNEKLSVGHQQPSNASMRYCGINCKTHGKGGKPS